MDAEKYTLAMIAPTPFFTEGGASSRILGEVRGLRALGARVRMLTYPSGREWPGIETVRPRRSSRQMGIGFHPIRPLYDLEMLRSLLGWDPVPGERWHAFLHEGAVLGMLQERLRGKRFVLDLQGSLAEELGRTFRFAARGVGGGLTRGFERWLERSAPQVIVSSPGLLALLQSRGHLPKDRVHLIADGVAWEDFSPRSEEESPEVRAWRTRRGLAEEDIVAIYVGGLSPEQGIDDVITEMPRMLKEEPRLRVVLFGRPTQLNRNERYVERIRSLGLEGKVLLLGPLKYEDLPAALRASDIGLTWKRAPPEEANGKIPVYMAAGLPTVALRLPASEYYLGPSGEFGGILAQSPETAAEAVLRLAREPALRQRLGQEGRRMAEKRFSHRAVAQQILQVYDKLG